MTDKINELIRDATKVGSIPKSEFRRRIEEIIKEEVIIEKINFISAMVAIQAEVQNKAMRALLNLDELNLDEQDEIQGDTTSMEEKLEALEELEK